MGEPRLPVLLSRRVVVVDSGDLQKMASVLRTELREDRVHNERVHQRGLDWWEALQASRRRERADHARVVKELTAAAAIEADHLEELEARLRNSRLGQASARSRWRRRESELLDEIALLEGQAAAVSAQLAQAQGEAEGCRLGAQSPRGDGAAASRRSRAARTPVRDQECADELSVQGTAAQMSESPLGTETASTGAALPAVPPFPCLPPVEFADAVPLPNADDDQHIEKIGGPLEGAPRARQAGGDRGNPLEGAPRTRQAGGDRGNPLEGAWQARQAGGDRGDPLSEEDYVRREGTAETPAGEKEEGFVDVRADEGDCDPENGTVASTAPCATSGFNLNAIVADALAMAAEAERWREMAGRGLFLPPIRSRFGSNPEAM